MTEHRAHFLVSTDWLQDHLKTPDVVVVDGTWHLPPTGRNGRAEYEEAHIPGAVFFDIDEITDTETDLPHMLPRPEKFASKVRRLGIGDGQKIVVYDQLGLFSAARVWWMFRVMGHRDVVVLDGGLPKWVAEQRPVEDLAPQPRERHFTARRNAGMVADADDIDRHLKEGSAQIVDARPADRFAGDAPEPRAGVRSGSVPGSLNLPFPELLNGDGTMKDEAGLRQAFADAGVDLDRPVITMCGSGVTASMLTLGLAVIDAKPAALYDGSWAEWGRET